MAPNFSLLALPDLQLSNQALASRLGFRTQKGERQEVPQALE